jgi:membrane-associated protein
MIELLQMFLDFFLNLDTHLVELLQRYGVWIYAILFLIVFSETGLVVTPWLPGDSLLFAVGALVAIDTSGTLQLPVVIGLLIVAAILGNTCNYGRYRLLRVEHLERTESFFSKHGGKTIVLSRFLPILRTFAPFVAGVGRMQYGRFQLFNVLGAISWVLTFVIGGYLFGNIPIIRDNFGIVTLVVIVGSLLPMLWIALRGRG